MGNNIKTIILSAACILALLVMFLLPLFSVPEYNIVVNTLSDLGAQFAPNAWIMNFVFVFVASSALNAGWGFYHGFTPHRIFLMLFTISLTLAAFFHHAPANPGVQYNMNENGWHQYFIFTAGFSFSILSIATGFITEKEQERPIAIAAGISVIFLSVIMSEVDRLAGIWQRLIFIISFGWLIYNFRTNKRLKNNK